jgi:hypothetical protein
MNIHDTLMHGGEDLVGVGIQWKLSIAIEFYLGLMSQN